MSGSSPFVIGIDGGASKTAALLASADGAVVVRHQGPASAIIGRPHATAIAVLDEAVRSVTAAARLSRSAIGQIVLGLSGVDYADELPMQKREIAEGLGVDVDRLMLINDSVVALAGATQSPRATIVQHGTEVTLAYRAEVGAEKVFDSLGVANCFDVRHRAVPMVARMIDGRATVTPLCGAVLTHCGVAADRFAEWVLRSKEAPKTILNLAPVVFAAWRAGDPAAAALVRGAVDDYVGATAAMASRIGPGPFAACFGGGTLAAGGSSLLEAIAHRLIEACPEARPLAAEHAPEVGAVLLALRKLGLAFGALPERLKVSAAESLA